MWKLVCNTAVVEFRPKFLELVEDHDLENDGIDEVLDLEEEDAPKWVI